MWKKSGAREVRRKNRCTINSITLKTTGTGIYHDYQTLLTGKHTTNTSRGVKYNNMGNINQGYVSLYNNNED